MKKAEKKDKARFKVACPYDGCNNETVVEADFIGAGGEQDASLMSCGKCNEVFVLKVDFDVNYSVHTIND